MSNVVQAYQLNQMGDLVSNPDTVRVKSASGQTVTCTTAGTDYTATVNTNRTYVLLAVTGNALVSLTGTVATAANIEYMVAKDHKVLIRVPTTSVGAATTTIHMTGSANSTIVYLAECEERS
jgi:hypothetical protein